VDLRFFAADSSVELLAAEVTAELELAAVAGAAGESRNKAAASMKT
jgi:hypothetical protein